jgi:hypothetical protein
VGSYFGARQTGKISRKTLLQWMGAAMVITSIPIFWVAYTHSAMSWKNRVKCVLYSEALINKEINNASYKRNRSCP